MRVLFPMLLLACLAGTAMSTATTYYVSPSGNDGNDGLSQATPWASLTHVTAQGVARVFHPGDSILFEGGAVFQGSLTIDARTAGTPEQPITFATYGFGRARFESGNVTGIYVYRTGGIHISSIHVVGSGRTTNLSAGIAFRTEGGNTVQRHVVIDNVEAEGYQLGGIVFAAWDGSSGYHDVTITGCDVHDNGQAGIFSYAQQPRSHRNWTVTYNRAYRNTGIRERTDTHTGSGILIGDVDTARIAYNEAYENGAENGHVGGGPVGIWTYNSNAVVIEYNESHHNHAGLEADGGGFDLDGGTTNCVMQYNFSHHNEGAGYLLAQYVDAPPMHHDTVRYNVSYRDGRKNLSGGILIWDGSPFSDVMIYNNTIVIDTVGVREGATPAAVRIYGGSTITNMLVANNVLRTTDVPAVGTMTTTPDTTAIRFRNNLYDAGTSPVTVLWGEDTYRDLATWGMAADQEVFAGTPVGIAADAGLPAAEDVPTIGVGNDQASRMTWYFAPSATSSARTTGLHLRDAYDIDPIQHDIRGVRIPWDRKPDIGAVQHDDPTTVHVGTTPLSLRCYVDADGGAIVHGITEDDVITIHDVRGRQWARVMGQNETVTFDVSSLRAGLYMVTARSTRRHTTAPLFIP